MSTKMNTYELIVSYRPVSKFHLNFDLTEVYDWHIKWDTLYVKRLNTDEWQSYEPIISAEDEHEFFKHPDKIEINEL